MGCKDAIQGAIRVSNPLTKKETLTHFEGPNFSAKAPPGMPDRVNPQKYELISKPCSLLSQLYLVPYCKKNG